MLVPLEHADPRLFGSPARQQQNSSNARGGGVVPASAATAAATTSTLAGSAWQLAHSATAGGGTGMAGAALSSSSGAVAPYVSEASLDFQRSLLQQQVQQAQRELERLKAELQDTNTRFSDTRQQLNEQKATYTSLTHRYGTTVEKLTAAEGDVKRLEEQLVKERNQRHQAQAEREQQRLALREAEWAQERLQRRLQQLDASRGLDPREVQRQLEDRTHYIPTVEVHRMQTEMYNTHQSLVDRLVTALESLTTSSEESQTNCFVARSAVLSAATDVEARLQRAEATLDDVDKQWTAYRDGVEQETHDFLMAVMAENKDLWQQLTLLQNEHEVVVAEAKLRASQGGSVPAEEHAYVQRQLELMTERLGKAQQLVESQTVLAGAHEAEMADLLDANDAMQRRLEELEQRGGELERVNSQKSTALAEADTALHEATSQIEELHTTLREERQRAEAVVSEMKTTQRTMQEEYDTRVRQLEHDCAVADDTATTLRHTLEETTAKLDVVERNLQARTTEFEAYKRHSATAQAETVGRQREDLQRVRAVMEEELATLRTRLNEAQEANRAAQRDAEEATVRESAATVAHHTAQQEVAHLQEELGRLRTQHREAVQQSQRAQAEADQLRAASGEGSTVAQELQRRVATLEKERAELAAALTDEKTRQEQRYAAVHTDWKASEKARAATHEELATLRTRCAELEHSRMFEERQVQDKEQLMRENIRLHEQYQLIQKECTGLREEVKTLRQRGAGDAQWHKQMEDLQRRLRELPELRQAADAARRDALTAKEETELLRRERDQLAKRLDTFLEDARQQSRREEAFERMCREASAAAQRIGGQVSSAKENTARYHVFRNTNPTARVPATTSLSPMSANLSAASAATGVGASAGHCGETVGKSVTSPAPGAPASASPARPAQSAQHRSPVYLTPAVQGAGGEAEPSGVGSAASSPSRPWR